MQAAQWKKASSNHTTVIIALDGAGEEADCGCRVRKRNYVTCECWALLASAHFDGEKRSDTRLWGAKAML
jgi:hypothetical protein